MVLSSPSKYNQSPATKDEISGVMTQSIGAAASLPIGSSEPSPSSGTKCLISHHADEKPEESPERYYLIQMKNKNNGKGIAFDDGADADDEASGPNSGNDLVNDEVKQKSRNQRSKKTIRPGGGAARKNGGLAGTEMGSRVSRRTETRRARIGVDARMAAETREKMRFSISLTKEEIEHDFILLTGAKPSRRPKRRNKRVQKEIDSFFPGSLLEPPLPDIYELSKNRKM